MGISINSRLTKFAQQDLVLGYSTEERARINSSLEQLEKVLRNKLGAEIQNIVRFGSFTRNTILPRKFDAQSDVDLLVLFNTSNKAYTPGTYRKWLHDIVTAAYPSSVSKKDFPVVKLELNHIMFDIVPGYSEDSLYNGKSYYIPGKTDTWQRTTPNDINASLSQKNQALGGNIVRDVIRLCKHWNAGAGYPYESYGMEKWIVERFLYSGDTLYGKFLSVMNDMAGEKAGVKQALDWIQYYKGSWPREADEQKQFEWLKRLLPGLP